MIHFFANRRHHSSNRSYFVATIAIFALNVIIFYVQDVFLQRSVCAKKDHFIKKRAVVARVDALPHRVDEIVGTSNATKEFNWEREQKHLVDLIPVIEAANNSKPEPTRSVEAAVLPVTDDESPVARILDKLRTKFHRKNRLDDLKIVFDDGDMFQCDDLKLLENSGNVPLLQQGFVGSGFVKGVLRVDLKRSFATTTYTIARPNKPTLVTANPMLLEVRTDPRNLQLSEEETFVRGADELDKLLDMHGWDGIPRVYGVCLVTQNGSDVMRLNGNQEVATAYIRYVVERHEAAMPLCEKSQITNKCIQLHSLGSLLKGSPNPPLQSIRLMYSFAKVFANFWKNGIFPYKIYPNEIVITSRFEVAFSSVGSFLRLTTSKENQDAYKRVMSDVMCKEWYECPTPGWQGHQLLFKLGQHCKEVRGYCDPTNRCWGLDAVTYLCVLSRWVFAKLEYNMPISWDNALELQNLLSCASQGIPNFRCDWVSFKRGMENLLAAAERSFVS